LIVTHEQLVDAFSEWNRRFTEAPETFEADFGGDAEVSATYLEQLLGLLV
jgi:hypothetical protein